MQKESTDLINAEVSNVEERIETLVPTEVVINNQSIQIQQVDADNDRWQSL